MNVETPAVPGLENAVEAYFDSIAEQFISGELQPHELPWDLWLVWSYGFRSGCDRMQERVDRAEREADYWYYVANNSAEERARHEAQLKAFDVVAARRAMDNRLRSMNGQHPSEVAR